MGLLANMIRKILQGRRLKSEGGENLRFESARLSQEFLSTGTLVENRSLIILAFLWRGTAEAAQSLIEILMNRKIFEELVKYAGTTPDDPMKTAKGFLSSLSGQARKMDLDSVITYASGELHISGLLRAFDLTEEKIKDLGLARDVPFIVTALKQVIGEAWLAASVDLEKMVAPQLQEFYSLAEAESYDDQQMLDRVDELTKDILVALHNEAWKMRM